MLGLLPQPGGFLFPRCEDTPPHNQAVAMRPDVEEIALDEIVATTDARLFVNDTDDVVPGVDQLRELCLIARPAPEVRREDVKQVVPPAAATRQMTVGYPEMSHTSTRGSSTASTVG